MNKPISVALITATIIISSACTNDRQNVLTAYTNTGFTGDVISLQATQGDCVHIGNRVMSAKNTSTSKNVALFLDTTCDNPVAVIAPGQQDVGFIPHVGPGPFDALRPKLTLLGQHGALSYRTEPAKSPTDSGK